MKYKGFLWWVVFVLLAIWQLPQFIVAVVMLPFLGDLKLIAERHFNFCFVGTKMQGGISLGPFAYVSPRSTNAESVAHELDGHTRQSLYLGPLYLLLVGLPSILNAWLGITDCYYDWFPEKGANYHAGLGVDENCRLYFIKNKKA